MSQNSHYRLLIFSLFGISLWFFGNLYEAVVISPNFLVDTLEKVKSWQAFFQLTNPVLYYIPITPLAVLVLAWVYFKTDASQVTLKTHLKWALLFSLAALSLGIYIITQINFKLFFGTIDVHRNYYRLSLLWNMLNVARVILLAMCIYRLFKGCVLVNYSRTKNKESFEG